MVYDERYLGGERVDSIVHGQHRMPVQSGGVHVAFRHRPTCHQLSYIGGSKSVAENVKIMW